MVSNQYKTSLVFFGYRLPIVNGAIVIGAGICGSMFVLWLSTLIAKYLKLLARFLSYTGRESLVVLCLHKLELNYVPSMDWAKYFLPENTFGFSVLVMIFKMIIIYIGPVSYTHLDVYKRQLYSCYFPADELYEKKEYPVYKNLAECNDGPLIDLRRMLKGEEDMLRSFVYRIKRNPEKEAVIQYITNHDGFTMMDLVSYEEKHNEENGENNLDGSDQNYSWNCGAEGKTCLLYTSRCV